MSKGIDKYLCNYEHFLILGDFNITMLDDNMKNFCETYGLMSQLATKMLASHQQLL